MFCDVEVCSQQGLPKGDALCQLQNAVKSCTMQDAEWGRGAGQPSVGGAVCCKCPSSRRLLSAKSTCLTGPGHRATSDTCTAALPAGVSEKS